MKTKLTLYVEEPVVEQAKAYAKRRKVALSGLVEEHLRSLGRNQSRSFADRWRGKFRSPDLGELESDPRLADIAAKHVK